MKNCEQTGLEFSYFSLLKLHDVKIKKNFGRNFLSNLSDSVTIIILLDQSLVNLSIFYVQMTNKMYYHKLKMRKYLLPT